MPINKQFLKSRPEVKVTFAVEREAAGEAEQVLLLGEFSQWQPIELKRMKNGGVQGDTQPADRWPQPFRVLLSASATRW